MRHRVRTFAVATIVLIGLTITACAEQSTTPVGVDVQLGKGGSPNVNSAIPDSAQQDTTLDVRVIGSGFDQGSVARFLRNGNATPKIVTNSTTFVDHKELIANITIALDADIDLYDIEVTSSRGKKGIGSELFAVVEKTNSSPEQTPLSIVVEDGTLSSDGGGAYVHDQERVDGFITNGGNLWFEVSDRSSRTFDIAEIRDTSGRVIVPETGPHPARALTMGCCDLREMTSDSAEVTLTGPDTVSVKLKLRWDHAGGYYVVSMGSNNGCIDPGPDGDPPDDDPGRGTWARVIRTSETTWTIESAGPAAVCEFIDDKGRKNDRYVLHLDAVVNLRFLLTGLE